VSGMGNASDLSTKAVSLGAYYFKLFDKKQLEKYGLPSAAIRAALAANVDTPASILAALATDPDRLVRLAVATNFSTTTDILEKLALDDDLAIVCRLKELDVSVDILVALMQNRNPYIRKQAELTWIGREFEKMLLESCPVQVAGDSHKLGELLVRSKIIQESDVTEALADCRLFRMPLGRALLQSELVSAEVLVKALHGQKLLREGKISVDDAIGELVRA